MRPMCIRVYCVSLHPLIQTVGMVTRSTGVCFAQGSLHEAHCQGGIPSHLLDCGSKSLRRVLCYDTTPPAFLCRRGMIRVRWSKNDYGTASNEIFEQFGGKHGAHFVRGAIFMRQWSHQNIDFSLQTLHLMTGNILHLQTTRQSWKNNNVHLTRRDLLCKTPVIINNIGNARKF